MQILDREANRILRACLLKRRDCDRSGSASRASVDGAALEGGRTLQGAVGSVVLPLSSVETRERARFDSPAREGGETRRREARRAIAALQIAGLWPV